MVHSQSQVKADAPVLSDCHTLTAHANADFSLNDDSSSDCGQCCVAAVLPSAAQPNPHPLMRTAPFAALFNHLPASAQRPAKPPLA